MTLKIGNDDLNLFFKDLWKDSRLLEVGSLLGQSYIRRYSDLKTSIADEYRFIKNVIDKVSFKVPEIIEHTDKSISFRYIAGTRAFNLLMDLRTLYREEKKSVYLDIGEKVIDLASGDLKEFQNLFTDGANQQASSTTYPAVEKVLNVYFLLCSVLSIDFPKDELTEIAEEYEKNAEVPFRDLSPKNIIIDLPALFQKQFDSRADRIFAVRHLVNSGELMKKMIKENFYHIDFSGCCFFCPKEDDWIALKQHEASAWMNVNTSSKDIFSPKKNLITQFVRFSRFGGRKLAYRLLNYTGYKIRFGLDDERYYFRKLIDNVNMMQSFGFAKNNRLNSMISKLEKTCRIIPEKDYFHAWKNSLPKDKYYSDIFPN